jgi:hypothetical protein
MKLLIVSSLAASLFLGGCESSTKDLVGGYRLQRFDQDGDYCVVAPNDPAGGWVFDGTIDQVGWNQNWILARVRKFYLGDTNGWYALNVRTKRVFGPVGESELSANKEWSQINCCPPELVKSRR